jgi:hypothetical protein
MVAEPKLMFTEDLSVFFPDFGVSVAFVGAEPDMQGLMDAPGLYVLADQNHAPINATDRSVVIRSDQVGTLAQGSTISVDAIPYTVREILPLDDGAFSLVSLR